MLIKRRRDFHTDSCAVIAQLIPALQILGDEFIPSKGPCVVTMNHYTRSGFKIWWAALSISSILPLPIHWVITSEWTTPGKWYEPFKSSLSRFIANRITQVYDFTSMPPMPPRSKEVQARVASVREVLTYSKQNEGFAMIGLAPEGGDQPDRRLMMPPPGVGRFCLLLAAQHLKFVPVGVYESKGIFYLNFGRDYELNVCNNLSTKAKDSSAAEIIMRNIASLLPMELRGEFN